MFLFKQYIGVLYKKYHVNKLQILFDSEWIISIKNKL